MLDDVSHILPSALYKIVSWRFKVVALKVDIGFFGAVWMVSWSWVDNFAATVITIRHHGQEVTRCKLYSLFERSGLFCIEISASEYNV